MLAELFIKISAAEISRIGCLYVNRRLACRELNIRLSNGKIFKSLIIERFVMFRFFQKDDCKNFVPSPHTEPEFSSVANFKTLKEKRNEVDNVFKQDRLYKPLLFAHRGGRLEAPESSIKAFKYAIEEAGADVLEIDVQLTADGEFVVWHGPKLENICIKPNKGLSQNKIYEVSWEDLNFKTCIGDPCEKDPCSTCPDNISTASDRRLLLLSEFLHIFRDIPLNIEMKESFSKRLGGRAGLKENISEFIKILDEGRGDRTIIIASARHRILKEFRKQSNENYPITNLSWLEILKLRFFGKVPEYRVLETTYNKMFSSERMIEEVRKSGGATYVFLTPFLWIPSIDANLADEKTIFDILDRGVDGIMTDRPRYIRTIMEKWLMKRN
jgi:glycerophosphoryl diester phosphodiesterase